MYGLQKEAMNYLPDIWVIWYTWQNNEALMAEEVTRLKKKVDITHKRYKELGLMQPLHPEETPNYSFSDLQLTIYREIILKSEE